MMVNYGDELFFGDAGCLEGTREGEWFGGWRATELKRVSEESSSSLWQLGIAGF